LKGFKGLKGWIERAGGLSVLEGKGSLEGLDRKSWRAFGPRRERLYGFAAG